VWRVQPEHDLVEHKVCAVFRKGMPGQDAIKMVSRLGCPITQEQALRLKSKLIFKQGSYVC
jgi:hypothetical protein